MAWTTAEVTQLGNTTTGWQVTGSALSVHDAIVVGLTEPTPSLIRIDQIARGVSPTRYDLSVTVVGSDAVSFRVFAEQMN